MMRIMTLVIPECSGKWGNPLRVLPVRIALFYMLMQVVGNPACGQQLHYLISDLVPIDSQTGDVVYVGVGRVKGASATDLFARAKTYFGTTVQPGSLVNVSRQSNRILRQRGILLLTVLIDGVVQPQAYRVMMEVKVTEGRYRYELSQFTARPDSVRGNLTIRELYPSNKRTFDIDEQPARALQSWDRSVRTYIAKFKQYMSANPDGQLNSRVPSNPG